MLLSCDRANFPLVAIETMGVETHLLPITKAQFELFMAETGQVSKFNYLAMLALNPVVPPNSFTLEEAERLFITGILPHEALAFARWLGAGFDLPTLAEWRAIYAALKRTSIPLNTPAWADLLPGPAGIILDKLGNRPHLHSMLDLSLLRGGLVEWVRRNQTWLGLGAPRPEFYPNLWDPLTNEITPLDANERLPYFGFRLVRRGEWYLADKEKVRYVD